MIVVVGGVGDGGGGVDVVVVGGVGRNKDWGPVPSYTSHFVST